MTCAWKELQAVLPIWMRKEIDMPEEALCEIRLRINSPPELISAGKSRWLERNISREDLQYTVNAASRYSPWAAATSAHGYITAEGGHRIGLCGEVVIHNGNITGISKITSLCIRVAGDFPGIAAGLEKLSGSILIIGAPGWGKTTLLRDLIRQRSQKEKICVVDERGELFPMKMEWGKCVDVLSGCEKKKGIPMLLRTMGPDTIAVDEITEPEDVRALIHSANCGVKLLATAHAASVTDLRNRSIYRPLLDNHLFDALVILNRNNTYAVERMTRWDSDGLVQF